MRTQSIAARCAAGIFGTLVMTTASQALEEKKYDAAAFKAAQSAGSPVVVHVTAPWCPTCSAQHAAIKGLMSKPELDKVTIFDVDFDSQADVMKSFKATAQSTLIAFSGAKETGRIVGETKSAAIEGLLKSATAK